MSVSPYISIAIWKTREYLTVWKAVVQDHKFLWIMQKQESRGVARKPRDVAAVLFGLKFVDIVHYKFDRE